MQFGFPKASPVTVATFASDKRYMEKSLGARYAKSGFEVHLLDLRNHGRSFHSDVFSYEAMTADVLSYCNAHQLDLILFQYAQCE